MAPGTLAVAGRWAVDEAALCLCITQGGAFDSPAMAAACGFDAVYIDLEHTAIVLREVAVLCSVAIGAGVMPLVRAEIGPRLASALDYGAMGVIVPHVTSGREAASVAQFCRFPPAGRRSVIGTNRATMYRPMSVEEAIVAHNAQTVVGIMIESRAAVDQLEDIVRTEGTDLFVVGPYDLASDLGQPGRTDHPAIGEVIEALPGLCRSYGKVAGIAGIREPERVGDLVRSGYRFVSVGTDTAIFLEAAAKKVSQIRAASVAREKEGSDLD